MVAVAANLAFIFPGGEEMIVLLIVGIMLFGRRLPEVGRAVAKTVVQLRQGLHKLKDEMDLDSEVADLRNSMRDVKDEFVGAKSSLSQTIEAPRRAIKDPGGMLMDLTDENLSVPSLAEIEDDLKTSLLSAGGNGTGETAADQPADPLRIRHEIDECDEFDDLEAPTEPVPDQT